MHDLANKKLTTADLIRAAKTLRVDVPTIRAVDEVESRGDGFLPTGEPKILFERHIFHRLTDGKYSESHPDISSRTPGGYGKYAVQHDRLKRAVALDREAALQSASWGRFQIMGFNYADLGYPSLQEFINDMYESEGKQLDAFVRFVQHNGLEDELQRKDWAGFARVYDGKAYRKNNYDVKLANAYRKYR